jgi:putative transposase
MPNHVHLILTPQDGDGLARALARTHRLYAGFVMRGRARPGICSRAASAPWRWTKII